MNTHFLAAALTLAASIATATDSPPNIILIMADDLGYGDLSCYGGEIPTPELDRLASEGMRLTDFHSSGNVCSPTRAGLMTGRYQQRAGIPGVIYANPQQPSHFDGLRSEESTFAEVLQAHGYETAIFGKWHLGYSRQFNPVHHGFREFRGFVSGNIDYVAHYDGMQLFDWWEGLRLCHERGYTTRLITKHGVDFIRRNQSRPFCLYLAHEAVHYPWQGPHDLPQRGPDKPRQPVIDRKRAFREMLIELDKSVGQVRDAVDRYGLGDNTFIFFCSDNGPDGGSAGPLRGKKESNWEGGHRVPGIAWWPGKIKSGSESDQLSITLDLMPTIFDIASLSHAPTKPFDGVSLAPLLLRGEALGQRQLFWNHKAMRDGPWKLIKNGKGGPQVGLYNLEEDLGEQHNLAATNSDRVAKMWGTLEAWYDDVTTNATPQN